MYAQIFQVISFPTKTSHASLLSPVRTTCPTNFVLLELFTTSSNVTKALQMLLWFSGL